MRSDNEATGSRRGRALVALTVTAASIAAVFAIRQPDFEGAARFTTMEGESTASILDPEVALLEPLPRIEVPVASRVARVEADWKQRAAVQYLARRYRVAVDSAADFVGAAFAAGQRVGIDPLLILAVMAVESRFNPLAESHMGAKGLMQIIPRFHLEKLAPFGGAAAVLDPDANVQVGARILKEYIRLGGSLESGLLLYNGSSDDAEAVYAQKVMAERQRLMEALFPGAKSAASATPAYARGEPASSSTTLAKNESGAGSGVIETVHPVD